MFTSHDNTLPHPLTVQVWFDVRRSEALARLGLDLSDLEPDALDDALVERTVGALRREIEAPMLEAAPYGLHRTALELALAGLDWTMMARWFLGLWIIEKGAW